MNPNVAKLKQYQDKIIGAELQLTLIESDLITVEGDIEFLESMLAVLMENLAILKTKGIIAIASEYKKTTQEIKTARDNLTFYNKLQKKLLVDFDKYQAIRDTCLQKYDELKKVIDDNETVLIFDQTKRKK